jgi:coproporphyrinogen III oxidase-like Fe-S oxidoreductase
LTKTHYQRNSFRGGTPTFFSPKNLEDLINGIFSYATKAPNYEFSFEGHPNNTTIPIYKNYMI